MRILVVEDSPTQAAALRQRLEGMGHQVTTLPSAVQAIDLLARDRFPVVMTDWIMPVLDGPTFCRRLRSELADGPYIFLVMMTSKDLRHERLEALESGADVFLTKPFDNVEISVSLGTISRLLASHQALARRIEELERGLSPSDDPGRRMALTAC